MKPIGLAHQLNNEEDKLISPHSLPGSFHYTAPENFIHYHEDGRRVKENLFDSDSDED